MLFCLSLGISWAQTPTPQTDAVPVFARSDVRNGERMSDWLIRNTDSTTDLTVIHWQVPSERAAQESLRSALIHQLQSARGLRSPARHSLIELLRGLPIEGRVLLASADARWLQGSPAQDPVLQANQMVRLLPRPKNVAVLGDDGRVCLVAQSAGAHAIDYVSACQGIHSSSTADWAWLVQADGRVIAVGLSPWNASPVSQTELAPGAWLWAPSRAVNFSQAFSDNLARFLSLQLPAETLFQASEVKSVARVLASPHASAAPAISSSDWGVAGLLQTPSARMRPAGAMAVTFSGAYPYTHGNVMFQPFDWLEAGFRYTDVANRLYGPEIAGTQSYKDKSIDLKVRLLEETGTTPQVALGIRDLGGTGMFSGEYLVANKRWGTWDASLGLGWGYLGARGSLKAPLGFLGNAYTTRPLSSNFSASQDNYQAFFRGDAAVFGGVQWQSEDGRWLVKAELDGNNYQHEPQDNNLLAGSPFNLGLVYRHAPGIELSLGWERGNTAMIGITLQTPLAEIHTPKLLDKALPKVAPMALQAAYSVPWGDVAKDIEEATGWKVESLFQQGASVNLVAQSDGSLYPQERLERATAVLHRYTPATVQHFVVELQQHGLGLARVDVQRSDWVAQRTQAIPPSLRLQAQKVSPTLASDLAPSTALAGEFHRARGANWDFSLAPSYHQILGGPDGFVLYELGVMGSAEWRLNPSSWVAMELKQRLLDNYQAFKYDAPSGLPRVRTDQRQYLTTSALTMPLLQLTHVAELGNNHYASLYGGMLESEFGGVGAEWLYRPWRGAFAFGVDVNRVRQRGYSQNLEFRDYTVNTGHATLYWDTGWNGVQANLMVGSYLAGDRGATLNLQRVFPNGVTMGAWATRTNVAKEVFGEGTFEKGIFVSVPFDLMLPKSSPGMASFVWQPLTRDGGARLNRSVELYGVTHLRDSRPWTWTSTRLNEREQRLRSADDRSYIAGGDSPGIFADTWDTSQSVFSGLGQLQTKAWLLGGGLVMAARLLDHPVDDWVQARQAQPWSQVATVSNAVPYALAAGAGMLWMGMAGDEVSTTAKTALTAAALTLGTNALTKYAVGRARPLEDRGAGQLDGFQATASQSSFASNHVAIAFAIATPFAQAYEQPWLYGLAASTAIGRLQSREHWLSDTVAGALMGYAIGSLAYQQQQSHRKTPRLTVGDRSVTASWSF